MDRLICGDVGYGKTEVAMRAAFKAVDDGDRSPVLVPTTILAQQHSAPSRAHGGLPRRHRALSRFRRPRSSARSSPPSTTGRVDIVIGTHRLLVRDVRFKDLGLLIIDEEQRFGVKQKERCASSS